MRSVRQGARRRWLLLFLVPLALAAGYAFGPARLKNSLVAAALADPSSIFAKRSPGARTGPLAQIKPARVASNIHHPFVPTERVLSTVRTRPSFPDTYLPVVDDPALVDPVALPNEPVVVPGIGDISLPGFGGGAIPYIPPGGVGQPEQPVVPDVPEPSTWLMMIGGFLMIGLALRSRPANTKTLARTIARS